MNTVRDCVTSRNKTNGAALFGDPTFEKRWLPKWPLMASPTDQHSQTDLRSDYTHTQPRQNMVDNCTVYVAFTTCSGYLEDKDCVPQSAHALRPSNRADESKDYVKYFIAAPGIANTPITASSPQRTRAELPAKSTLSSKANKKAPTVHQARSPNT